MPMPGPDVYVWLARPNALPAVVACFELVAVCPMFTDAPAGAPWANASPALSHTVDGIGPSCHLRFCRTVRTRFR